LKDYSRLIEHSLAPSGEAAADQAASATDGAERVRAIPASSTSPF